MRRFPLTSRILHWTMAVMVIAMLFIGIGMVASLADYHRLVTIHKPLGIAILILVAIRLVNRLVNPPPPLPASVPASDRMAIQISVIVLYALMFALPLVGWAMLSAADYPVVLFGALTLPPILPHDPPLYAVLRTIHSALAFLLFGTFLAHFSGAMLHALITATASLRAWPHLEGRGAKNSPPANRNLSLPRSQSSMLVAADRDRRDTPQ